MSPRGEVQEESLVKSPSAWCMITALCSQAYHRGTDRTRDLVDWMLFLAAVIALEYAGARVLAGIAAALPILISVGPTLIRC